MYNEYTSCKINISLERPRYENIRTRLGALAERTFAHRQAGIFRSEYVISVINSPFLCESCVVGLIQGRCDSFCCLLILNGVRGVGVTGVVFYDTGMLMIAESRDVPTVWTDRSTRVK